MTDIMDQQIIDNIVIAEFDGWKEHSTLKEIYTKGDMIISTNKFAIPKTVFNYDTDWNSLMPVVEKIYKKIDSLEYNYTVRGRYEILRDALCSGNISDAFDSVVKLIKWCDDGIAISNEEI